MSKKNKKNSKRIDQFIDNRPYQHYTLLVLNTESMQFFIDKIAAKNSTSRMTISTANFICDDLTPDFYTEK